VGGNYTLRVKSRSMCGNRTLLVEINLLCVKITLVRFEVTFVPFEITLRVEITLCVYQSQAYVSNLLSCV
jgi:hypothetical protein